jgi:hypothetical protein
MDYLSSFESLDDRKDTSNTLIQFQTSPARLLEKLQHAALFPLVPSKSLLDTGATWQKRQ